MWKIHCVGTGSAFNTKDLQTNFLIESPTYDKFKKWMMLDCGTMAPFGLQAFGVNNGNIAEKIDAFYVSHLHADHIGGLEWVAFCTYFKPDRIRPKLICVNKIMRPLWRKSLRGGLESIQGKQCTLTDYFECNPIQINEKFFWQNLQFIPVQTVHIMNGMEIVPSYGLLIQEFKVDEKTGWKIPIGQKVFITTDTQFCPNQIQSFYEMSDVIIHDCETSPFKSGVHAHSTELVKLAESTKKKMRLVHYQPLPDELPSWYSEFHSILHKGDTITLGG